MSCCLRSTSIEAAGHGFARPMECRRNSGRSRQCSCPWPSSSTRGSTKTVLSTRPR
jgi:hypothetical protein